ncbi:histidine kinase [Hymenobacter aerilatus]|uniref:Histidine kinase n=1 Tax=Hymenobacter aerilatus TaxID=2932251 RepID=A0A8T9T330_9BACT|nr:histidine kinase [Hymenobacter aerilatus]UOR07574.1 histidine kinase [Hymenobacter aerilatus]
MISVAMRAHTKAEVPTFKKHYANALRWWQLLGLMLLLSVGLTFLFCPGCAINSEDFRLTFGYNVCYTVGLWLANGYPAAWLNRKADWRQEPLRRFLLTVGLSTVLSLLVIVLVNGGFRVLYHHRPLRELLEPRVWGQFILPLVTTTVVSLFIHSRSFLLGWREAAIRTQRLEKESAVARLDSLRRQVDPHFLFNSLNALTVLVEENDPARATRFIRQLAQVYRYVLDSQEQEVVPLTEELAFVESYLHLQRTRLGEGIQVEIKQPDASADTLLVPPLAVQLLLENAFKHNATSQRNPLHITVEIDPAARELRVANTLRPRTVAAAESTGLGLRNLQARYGFLTEQPVRIERTATEFVVALPLLTLG